jgi:hypothetical protein
MDILQNHNFAPNNEKKAVSILFEQPFLILYDFDY